MAADATTDPIASRFSAAAGRYDAHACLQQTAAARLGALLPEALVPQAIIDLGCGTGELLGRLRQRYPQARFTGIDRAPGMVALCRERWVDDPATSFRVADIATVAESAEADLIASSFAFQWLADGPGCLQRWARRLRPGGLVALAVPVAGSLERLARRYQAATGNPFPGLAYPAAEAYCEAAVAAGLELQRVEQADLEWPGGNTLDLLRALRGLGAVATPAASTMQPATAGALRRLLRGDEAERDGFRVLYLIAARRE